LLWMWGSSSVSVMYCIMTWWWRDSAVVLTNRLGCRWVWKIYVPCGVCRC